MSYVIITSGFSISSIPQQLLTETDDFILTENNQYILL